MPRRLLACLVGVALFAASPAVPCLLQCLTHARQPGGHHDHGAPGPCAGGQVDVDHGIPGALILAAPAARLVLPPVATPVSAPARPAVPAAVSFLLVPEPPPPRR